MADSIHDGHRQRMREEILKNGINESTPDHKVLEFLLFYSISRKDTNDIGHMLIEKFGSLSGVFDAPISELMAVDGIGERSAVLLKSIIPIARIYLSQKENKQEFFSGIDELGEFAVNKYVGIPNERAAIISLDGKGKLLGFDFLSDGDISSVGISFRDVIGILIRHNAVAAVLVHNHPSGIALPSMKDSEITKSLSDTLRNIGIYLIDHIIVGAGDFVSMAQSKDYADIFM